MSESNHVLSRRELLELEGSIAHSVEVLQACMTDPSITASNRALARETLTKAEANLIRIRRLLGIPAAVPDVR
jgi:hypothetical protein